MLENENLVSNDTENVETPTEEPQVETPVEKTYTQSELDAIVGKRLARNSEKIRKEYDKKYGDLENVLRAGTGKESVEEMTDTFTKFYESKGVKLPEKPIYNDKDVEILAKADAADIINAGYEEVVEEINRLADLGVDNISPREKAYLKVLAEHQQKTERQKELSKIGVTEDVYNSNEFQDFAKQFNSNIPIADIYSIYAKTQPKKQIKPMGSMKNTPTEDTGVKEFYSYEEANQFTVDDLNKNPALYEAIKKSMTKW
jgi:hypothetical protein